MRTSSRIAVATLALAIMVPTALATHTTSDGLSTEGCAVTKGGWGAEPSGHNPGALLHHWFDAVFPSGFTVGDLTFDDAQDVTDFLPDGGEQLEEQTVALYINVAFGANGLLDGYVNAVVVESDNDTLDGMTGEEILDHALWVLDNDPTPTNAEYSDLIEAITGLNEESFGCAEPCPYEDFGFTAIANADGSISLSWNDVGVDSYNLYRAADGGDFVFLAATSGTNHTDTSTAVGVTYEYVLTVTEEGRESPPCAYAETTAVPFFGGAVLTSIALLGAVGVYVAMRRKA